MELLESLKEYSSLFLSKQIPEYERDLLHKLNLKNRIIGIVGAKGVGKTTLLLQYMKKQNLSSDEMLYISIDHPLMSATTILDIAKEFASYGGKLLILDEIHKQDNFAIDLKTIWDFLEINVIFSGSSALHLDNADLSRRVLKYTLPTLSFREFIEIQTNKKFAKLTLEEILSNHAKHSQEILSKIKPLKHFKDYFKFGFYPFYLEDEETVSMKLAEAINKTIDIDLLQIYNIDPKKLRNIKKILTLLCTSVPYKPNMTTLASSVEVDPKTLYIYLDALQKGRIIRMVSATSRGESIIKKPEKIYLDNPNMFNVLCPRPDIGTLRESFYSGIICNAGHSITVSKKGDFIVDEKHTIEVGGKSKSFKQIKDMDNSYVVADDIEVGNGNKIPLYLFGFLY
ncbi:ATP-binding protein [Sulfurimonas sp. SAG-AH-194-I05]|nr:AAA family ATPase [Sulfurimonas sp. SAG-AH-194-I05]MDF1875220.1 ATP-binding protein [Sulfurimonas sp. SAG-AH-194-I05]